MTIKLLSYCCPNDTAEAVKTARRWVRKVRKVHSNGLSHGMQLGLSKGVTLLVDPTGKHEIALRAVVPPDAQVSFTLISDVDYENTRTCWGERRRYAADPVARAAIA